MALTFPRRPVVEFFLGQWQDVSTDVRQSPALTVTHGRKDWAPKTSPALCKFTLDDGPEHGDGDYDPNNPLGQWFGVLGRNTPVRVGLPVAEDTFTRTVVDGWGTADSGELWTTNAGAGGTVQASDWQVAGGVATHSVPTTSAYRYSTLPVSARDVEITATVTVAITNITGGAIEPGNLMVRRDAGTYYMTRVSINQAEVLTISIHHSTGGQLVAPVTVSGLVDPVSSKVIRVKMQAEGHTIRAKVYAPGAEPVGWHVEVDDEQITTAGEVGIRDGVASGNSNTKPIVFSVDDVEVRLPRFAGETSKMVPLTSVDHTNQRTTVECASIRRRLSKGDKAFESAFRRFASIGGPFTVTDLWPLDEPNSAPAHGLSATGGPPAVFTRNTGVSPARGAAKWGESGNVLTSVPRFVALNNEGALNFTVDSTPLTTVSSVMWAMSLSSDTGGRVWLHTTAGINRFVFFFYTDGFYELYANPSGDLVASGDFRLNAGLDGEWLTFGLTLFNNGAGNIGFHINRDGETLGIGGWTSDGSYTPLNGVILNSELGRGQDLFSTLFVTSSRFDTLVSGTSSSVGRYASDVIKGWPGERAGDRFVRLCAEEGVSAAVTGDPADTPAMGAQRPLTLLRLTQECVDVVQGAALDPKGAPALGMRTHRATTVQGPVLTLAYEGQVSPEFGPTTDDQGTVNDVTAKRPHGGEHRIEQATGPVNTQDPGADPDAVGRYDTDVTTNVATDVNLPDQAGWRVHLGTVDGPRYPTVTVDFAADDVVADPGLVSAVLDVGVDDRIDITGVTARRIYDDVRLVVRGWTETLDTAYQHKIVFNTTPYAPHNVAVYNDAESRYDTAGSSLAADVTSSATSFTVNVTAGQLWTTAAGQFPLEVMVGGERIRLSAISGTSSPQTFTVDTGGRAVNGVAKAHSAGAAVALFNPVYYGH